MRHLATRTLRAFRSTSHWKLLLATLCCAPLLSACHHRAARFPSPLPYTMTMGDHYILLNKLRKQGVGIIEIGSTLTLIMQTDCFFQGTSTKLKPHRAYTLDLVAQLVKSYPNTPVTVSGHTDIVPTSKRQKSKTFDYAQVIASYLWNHGVPMQHVRVVADGSKYNVSKMSTSQGAADNRRVELYIGVRDPY